MEKKETPDAVYSSYAEMQEKEKDLAPISFSNGVGDQSRVIKVTEDLAEEYDYNTEFEAEVVPHIQPVRMFCQEHNIPFLFVCAPASTAEVDDKGEKTGLRSLCSFQGMYAKILRFPSAIKNLRRKYLEIGRAHV